MVKNNVKRMTIVGLAAVAGMSLFACKKPEAPIPNADIRIDVDADINDGNKINEKEDKLKGANNGSKGTKNNEYNNLNTEKWITIDNKTYNRATGKPRTIEETIGDLEIVSKVKPYEDEDIYDVEIIDKNGNPWTISIAPDRQVSVLKDKDGRETMVSGNVATAEELIATANAMDNISRNMGAIK